MLLIYLSATSPRCDYVFDLIFKNQWGIPFRVTHDENEFGAFEGARINYSGRKLTNEFFIQATPLLWEQTVVHQEVPVKDMGPFKILFPSDKIADLEFDIFAAVFYMVTRYEEYLPYIPDRYGRFDVKSSMAFQNHLLEKPVADLWILHFRNRLEEKFPFLSFRPQQFEAILTYDVDVAYKFRGRGFFTKLGSSFQDLLSFQFRNLSERFQTDVLGKKDPWDTYPYLKRAIGESGLRSIFFFLVGERAVNDRNLNLNSKVMQELVQSVLSYSEVGIHPSFESFNHPGKIELEKRRLELSAGISITKSRQHFLKFVFPRTFCELIDSGITEDYSMGYPSHAGFRAGTCKPFFFYDLSREISTPLQIFPITFMEGNFMEDTTLTPKKVLSKIKGLIEAVREVHGTFISIWHNHSVSDTKDYHIWREIHNEMILSLTSKTPNPPDQRIGPVIRKDAP